MKIELSKEEQVLVLIALDMMVDEPEHFTVTQEDLNVVEHLYERLLEEEA